MYINVEKNFDNLLQLQDNHAVLATLQMISGTGLLFFL
jgi:hypothetical protein